jgi:toxin FitB
VGLGAPRERPVHDHGDPGREILYGLGLLPSGERRAGLEAAVSEMFATDFAGRVLPFDQAAAQAYAEIAVARRRGSRPITQFDAQIAAIARSRDADLATRTSPISRTAAIA